MIRFDIPKPKSSEKIILLIKKLKELAERGIGGEKDNAERMMWEIMLKHGITSDMIEENELKKKFFYYLKGEEWLLVQTIAAVVGSKVYKKRIIKEANQSRYRWMVTDSEAIEIWARFGFYKSIFEEEIKKLKLAFIIKHKIFANDVDRNDVDASEKELKEFAEAMEMSNTLSNKSFRKQLTNG